MSWQVRFGLSLVLGLAMVLCVQKAPITASVAQAEWWYAGAIVSAILALGLAFSNCIVKKEV